MSEGAEDETIREAPAARRDPDSAEPNGASEPSRAGRGTRQVWIESAILVDRLSYRSSPSLVVVSL
jgi:hypothetical protein